MLQFIMMYMTLGIMYSMMIFSDPEEQIKTELLLSGMEIPPDEKGNFRVAVAIILMFFWPFDLIARSKL